MLVGVGSNDIAGAAGVADMVGVFVGVVVIVGDGAGREAVGDSIAEGIAEGVGDADMVGEGAGPTRDEAAVGDDGGESAPACDTVGVGAVGVIRRAVAVGCTGDVWGAVVPGVAAAMWDVKPMPRITLAIGAARRMNAGEQRRCQAIESPKKIMCYSVHRSDRSYIRAAR